jgi:GYF domain 2
MSTPTLWYYHKEARAFGPVQEADIGGLLARNEIPAEILVWRDGLDNWTEAESTELNGFLSGLASPPPVSIVPQSRRKHSAVFWLLFTLAEIFNFLIFGVPLFVALVLTASGAIIPTVKTSTDRNFLQQQEQQQQTNQIPE